MCGREGPHRPPPKTPTKAAWILNYHLFGLNSRRRGARFDGSVVHDAADGADAAGLAVEDVRDHLERVSLGGARIDEAGVQSPTPRSCTHHRHGLTSPDGPGSPRRRSSAFSDVGTVSSRSAARRRPGLHHRRGPAVANIEGLAETAKVAKLSRTAPRRNALKMGSPSDLSALASSAANRRDLSSWVRGGPVAARASSEEAGPGRAERHKANMP